MRNAAARSRDYGVSDHTNEGAFNMADTVIDEVEAAAKRKAYMAEYYAFHREKLKARSKQRYDTVRDTPEYREGAKARNVKWAAANSDKVRAKMTKWRDANRDVAREATRKWRAKHPDRALAAVNRWAAENPERVKANKANRRTRELSAEGVFTASDVKALFTRQRGRCVYCRVSIKDGYHVDHIIALVKGGTNWPKNLQLTCPTCNMRKHAKHPVDFAREVGMLL